MTLVGFSYNTSYNLIFIFLCPYRILKNPVDTRTTAVDTTKCVPTRPEKNWPSIVPLAKDFAREPGTSSTKQPWILKLFSNSCHPLFMSEQCEHLSHPHHDCSWCARSAKLQRWRVNGLNFNDGLRTIRIERGTILFNAWAGRLKHGFGVCCEAIFLNYWT